MLSSTNFLPRQPKVILQLFISATVGPPPTFPPGDCIIPIAPTNGQFSPQRIQWVVGDTVTYSCNVGFRLEGVSVQTCRPDGSYTSTPPFCARKYYCNYIFLHPCWVGQTTARRAFGLSFKLPAAHCRLQTICLPFTLKPGKQQKHRFFVISLSWP